MWAFSRGIDWPLLLGHLRACDPLLLGVTFALVAGQLLLRAWRWLALLEPYGIGYRAALDGIIIATAGNNVFPARAGEVMRVTWMASACRRPLAGLLVTVVVERVLDLFLLACLVAWAATWAAHHGWGGTSAWMVAAGVMLLAAVGGMAFLVVAAWTGRQRGANAAQWIPRRWREGAIRVLHQVSTAVFRDTPPRLLGHALARTLLLWVLSAAAFGVGMRAVGVQVGVAGSFVILAVVAAGVALPSAPGFIGTFHYACRAALECQGIPAEQAAAAAIVLHGVLWVVSLAWGAAVVARLTLRTARAEPAEAPCDPA